MLGLDPSRLPRLYQSTCVQQSLLKVWEIEVGKTPGEGLGKLVMYNIVFI